MVGRRRPCEGRRSWPVERRKASALDLPAVRLAKNVPINSAVRASGTCHSEATTALAPAGAAPGHLRPERC